MANTATTSSEEVSLDRARELANAGTHIFVWIGAPFGIDVPAILKVPREQVISVSPMSLADDSTVYRTTIAPKKPIFVCHHGISSLEMAAFMRESGIEAYSLSGGIEEARKEA
jgi:rhodanese-related sulfurtransferase